MKRMSLLAPPWRLAAARPSVAAGDDDPLSSGRTVTAATTLRVGSANFPESVVLAEIYAGALEAKGIKVETKLNIGSRETYLPALHGR